MRGVRDHRMRWPGRRYFSITLPLPSSVCKNRGALVQCRYAERCNRSAHAMRMRHTSRSHKRKHTLVDAFLPARAEGDTQPLVSRVSHIQLGSRGALQVRSYRPARGNYSTIKTHLDNRARLAHAPHRGRAMSFFHCSDLSAVVAHHVKRDLIIERKLNIVLPFCYPTR